MNLPVYLEQGHWDASSSEGEGQQEMRKQITVRWPNVLFSVSRVPAGRLLVLWTFNTQRILMDFHLLFSSKNENKKNDTPFFEFPLLFMLR